jgi:hypothetical protein
MRRLQDRGEVGKREQYVCADPAVGHFEMRFCSAKERGMAVPAVLRLVHLLAPCPFEPRSTPTHTGGPPARREACVPFQKSKSKMLLV